MAKQKIKKIDEFEAQSDEALTYISVEKIIEGNRRRSYYAKLKPLADSIKEIGQEVAILVTPHPTEEDKYILVQGGRRLRAIRDELKRDTIKAVVRKNITSITVSEAAENNEREPFSPLEKLAIYEALMEEVGERRGRPSDDSDSVDKENVPDFGHIFRKGEKSRDFAARVSGLGSKATLDQVKAVAEKAIGPVREALNRSAISINRAYEIAQCPEDKQPCLLRLANSDEETDKVELRKLLEEMREKKRLEGVGINPTIKNSKEFPVELEARYPIIYASPDFFNAKIKTLSEFPLKRHVGIDSLVFIEAYSIHAHKAYELAAAWGLFPKDVIAFYSSSSKSAMRPLGGYTKDVSSKIMVICGTQKDAGRLFRNVKVPFAVEVKDTAAHLRDFVKDRFGPEVKRSMLDITLRGEYVRPCWTSCFATFNYCLE